MPRSDDQRAHARELAARNRARAEAQALRLWDRVGGVKAQRAAGLSISQITDYLNAASVPAPAGGRWHRTSVARLIRRAEGLIARHGDGVLLTWEHVRYLRSALERRREESRRLHPRHAEDLVELPEPPEGARPWEWVALGVAGGELERLRLQVAAEYDRVAGEWRFAREEPGRLERMKARLTRPHEADPGGLLEALLQLNPDLDRDDLVDDAEVDVVAAWIGHAST